MNIAEIELQLNYLAKEVFEPTEFIFKFIEIFDAPKVTIDKLRKGTQNKADVADDLLWQRKLYFRLAEKGQSAITVDALKVRKPAKTNKPRFIISTDGIDFSAFDTKADETIHCDFLKINDHFDFFLPLAGIDKYQAVEENPADIKAAGRLAKFHDEIMRANPEWHTEEKLHALNQFMTRILFCLFSEDTGSFTQDIFVKTITEFGGEDGEYLSTVLKQIFDVMNTSYAEREELPTHIKAFPYVNGGLFADQTEVPVFSKRAKRVLIEAAELDWQEINPDIFGSMIQAVVNDDMRGDLGMHYTSVPNIMKVLHPLFLMSLEEEFAEAHDHREEKSRLKRLLSRISTIRVFDPACGSGNFLIIAYRELRSLEMRIFQRQDEISGGQSAIRWESGIKLSNFYGIELADFAAETAKLSLWIAEYQMNQKFKVLFGESKPDFPLKKGGHIFQGNALHYDWMSICPSSNDSKAETYIVGNPPYLGSGNQNSEQKNDLKIVFSPVSEKFKNLDYVAAWYLKGGEYCKAVNAQCAFVATNSICQGEQVAMLWPLIFANDLEIGFAYQSFTWRNLAAKNAGVTCVIVGIRRKTGDPKFLYGKSSIREVSNISPYLIEMSNVIVHKKNSPSNKLPPMDFGNKLVDGGNLILSFGEKESLEKDFPQSSYFIRRLYGSQELIKGIQRWCLLIKDSDVDAALSIPPIADRITKVREMRLASTKSATRKCAATPHQFGEVRGVDSDHIIVIPRVSSENREYLPVGIVDNSPIIQDRAFGIYNGPVFLFAIIASRLHHQWIATVCGRLRTDFNYSNTLGYNTFPLPVLTDNNKAVLEEHAWSILQIRETYVGKTIAWLYDPKTMPSILLEAHKSLDDTFEKMYIGRPFKDDTERLEHLFKMYSKMTAKKKEAVNA